MTDIIRLIVKIILIILLPLMLLIYIVEMNKLGVFENIKNLFSNDDKTNEVVVDTDVVNPDDVKIIDDGTHLIFNNVPINGSLKNYVAQMEKKNFRIYVERFGLEGDEETKEQKEQKEQKAKLEAYKEGKVTMVGDFADFKKCRLYVETLANKDLVYKIQVEFKYVSEWDENGKPLKYETITPTMFKSAGVAVSTAFGTFLQQLAISLKMLDKPSLEALKALSKGIKPVMESVGTFTNAILSVISAAIPDEWDENGKPTKYRKFTQSEFGLAATTIADFNVLSLDPRPN